MHRGADGGNNWWRGVLAAPAHTASTMCSGWGLGVGGSERGLM